MPTREQLERAIASQQSLRGTVDDAVIDSAIAALREALARLARQPGRARSANTSPCCSPTWLVSQRWPSA
jgi:hypothetical protein